MFPEPVDIVLRLLAEPFEEFLVDGGWGDDGRAVSLDAALPNSDLICGIHQFTHQMVMDNGGAKGFEALSGCQCNAGVVDGVPKIKWTGCIHEGADDINFGGVDNSE